jgi:hypothetical protein
MAAGWAQFRRDRALRVAGAPDRAVAAPSSWVIRAALVASSAVLLGTSYDGPDSAPSASDPVSTTYDFERSVEGESVELTRDSPRALFLFTVRATGLGPFGATTTDGASVHVTGSISTSETDVATPGVRVDSNGAQRVVRARGEFAANNSLLFEGTCDAPAEDAPCQASFFVELWRNDDGQQGGSVRVDWSLLLQSHGSVAEQHDEQDPLDPPWTVEVERP